MMDYVNFEGLSHFFNRLFEKFSTIGHTHTKSEIADLQDLIVSDDDNGNVSITLTSVGTLAVYDNARAISMESKFDELNENINTLTINLNELDGNVDVLKTDVNNLKSVVDNNDFLVVNNDSN